MTSVSTGTRTIPSGRIRRPPRSGRPLAHLGLCLVAGGLALVLPLAGTAGATGRSASSAPPTTTDPARVGLFGAQDPTFDGVYRQSLALLATVAAGHTPAPEAVDWLLAQQCADGGFEAFRASPGATCAPPDSASFSGEDTNSTGIAVQALHALGHGTQAADAVDWLATKQSADGGWAYYPDGAAGNDPDANSTSLGLSAFLAVGRSAPHAGGPGGPTPYDALEALQVGCEGAVGDRGAFTFFGSPNDYATVQATLAVAGGFLPVAAQSGADDSPVLTCPAAAPVKKTAVAPVRAKTPNATPTPSATPSATTTESASPSATTTESASPTATTVRAMVAQQLPVRKHATAVHVLATAGLTPAEAADAAAGYLVRRLAANGHVVPDPFNPGQTDFGSTANAVIALVATRHGSSQVTGALAVLAGQVDAFVVKSGADQPGALALLILAATAGGQDPAAFGGADLATRLAATVTVAAAASPSPSSTTTPQPAPGDANDPGSTLPDTGAGAVAGLTAGLGLLLLVAGAALVLGARRGSRQV
jgi:hypothetical protein